MIPKRIQRKRTKGFKLPPNTVCVTRGTKWGNPYRIGIDGNANECVIKYVNLLEQNVWSYPSKRLAIKELKGKNLACFCKENDSCHADILLKIANGI